MHLKVVSKLSKHVWVKINEVSKLAIGTVDIDATADDSEIEDPEDIVQLSRSSEDEATQASDLDVHVG